MSRRAVIAVTSMVAAVALLVWFDASRWSEHETGRFHDWLTCEECVDGELAFIRDTLGDRAREPLREVLLDLPPAYLDRARAGVIASLAQLPPSIDSAAYVDSHLSTLEATLQRRAAVGLAALGDTATLREAVDRAEAIGYQPDVVDVVEQALTALGAPGYGLGGGVTVAVIPATDTLAVGDSAFLVARLRDADGRPVAGSVQWSSSDSGSVAVSTPRPRLAQIRGLTVGSATITATAGVASADVAVEVLAPGGPTPNLVIVGGDAQIDTAGTELDVPLTVRLSDASGDPIARENVVWRVSRGTGAGTAVTTSTDSDGRASHTPTLGPTPEIMWVDATALGQRVRFRIRTRPP